MIGRHPRHGPEIAISRPRIQKRSVVFSTPWFQVRVKKVLGYVGESGSSDFYAVRPADYVSVLACADRDRILLVRQYRPIVEIRTLELPSGCVERGETPRNAARRELLEETGYRADRLETLGVLRPDVGRLENRLWCFLATGVRKDAQRRGGEPGVEPVLLSRREFARRIRSGAFDHALHLAVVALATAKGRLTLP